MATDPSDLLTKEQNDQIDDWLYNNVYPDIIAEQKAKMKRDDPAYFVAQHDWDEGHPYQGASGGGVTYKFTPTSIGIVVKVQEQWTGKELDVTDYDTW